jgi:DNA-binding PadR family transcriptional regulator
MIYHFQIDLQDEVEVRQIASDMSRLIVLSTLFAKPAHGYQILEELEEKLGRRVSPGLIYPFLGQLERRKLLTHKKIYRGKKVRKVYELTGEGRKFCTRIFKRMATMVSQAIEPTLNACSHCGCKVYEGGHVEVVSGRRLMFCCSHCAKAYSNERRGT